MSEQTLNNIIANNICNLMRQKDKTQEELAAYMGVSQATVSYWCKGSKMPRMDKIDRICAFLNCRRSDLMEVHSPAASGVQIELTEVEAEHIRRYRYLDDSGREFVDTVLNREYDRCAAEKGSLSSVISC